MRHLLLAPLLLVATPAFAQTTPVQPLPRAILPAPDADTAAVLAPVRALLAAVAARNPALVLPYVSEGATVTVADQNPDGTSTVRHASFAQWATSLTPGPERYEERMDNPAVEIDGDIAMVWGFYVFRIDGRFTHCGVDHFSLVRENGGWKIAALAWSSRTTGCGE